MALDTISPYSIKTTALAQETIYYQGLIVPNKVMYTTGTILNKRSLAFRTKIAWFLNFILYERSNLGILVIKLKKWVYDFKN